MSTTKRSEVYMSERHINPEEVMAGVRAEKYTWAGVLTILSALMIIAMLVLLWMDYASLNVA